MCEGASLLGNHMARFSITMGVTGMHITHKKRYSKLWALEVNAWDKMYH